MNKKSALKEIALDTFTTRGLESVWRYTHLFRWEWFLVLPVCLLVANSNGSLSFSMFLLAFLTGFLKLFATFWVSRSENQIQAEKIVMAVESMLFGFWSGALGLHFMMLIFLFNFLLTSILYFNTKVLYSNIPLYIVGICIGFAYAGFTVNQVTTYWDYIIFILIMLQALSINLLIRFVSQKISQLDALTQKDNNLLSNLRLLNIVADESNKNEIIVDLHKSVLRLLEISQVLYYRKKEEHKLFLDKEFSSILTSTDETFLAGIVLSSQKETDFLNRTFQQGSIYFHIKDEKNAHPLDLIFDNFNASILLLFPQFKEGRLAGVFVFVSSDDNFMKKKLKCIVTEFIVQKLFIAEDNIDLFREGKAIKEKNEHALDIPSRIIAPLKKYFPEHVAKSIVSIEGKNAPELIRKRILILTLDLSFLLNKKFAGYEMLSDFYHFIFGEFNKICKNYNAAVKGLMANKLEAYWEEGDISLKDAAGKSLLAAMELREIIKAYIKTKLKNSITFSQQLKVILSVSYVTFDSFGSKKYCEYTYFSPQVELASKSLELIPGYSIICDESVSLMVGSDVTAAPLPGEKDMDCKLYVLLPTDHEKQEIDKIPNKVKMLLEERKKGSHWKTFINWINPTHMTPLMWTKTLLSDLVSSKGIDPFIRYLQRFRWMSIPILIGMSWILYKSGELDGLAITLIIFMLFNKLSENFCAKRLSNPIKYEKNLFMIVDSFCMGAITGICSLPLIMIFFGIYVLQSFILYFGMRPFPLYFLSFLVGIVAGLGYNGFSFYTVANDFANYYFFWLMLFSITLISFTKIIYSKVLKAVAERETQQRENLKNLMESTSDSANIATLDSLVNHTAFFMRDAAEIDTVLYYKLKDNNQCFLKNISETHLPQANIKVLKSLALSTEGEDNIFLGTFQRGNLYFIMSEHYRKKTSSSLFKIMDILNVSQLIICPHFKNNKLEGLTVFATSCPDIMTDNLRFVPFSGWSADLLMLIDKINFDESSREMKNSIDKLKHENENIQRRLEFIMPKIMRERLISGELTEAGFTARQRVVTLYIDLRLLIGMMVPSEIEMTSFYGEIFDNFYKIAREHGAEVEPFSADRLVSYWVDDGSHNFKELVKRAFLTFKSFREKSKELFTIENLDAEPFRAAVNTNYVTLSLLGNNTLQQLILVNPIIETLVKTLITEPANTVLCDEATILLVKDTVKFIALNGNGKSQNMFRVFLQEEDESIFQRQSLAKNTKKNSLLNLKNVFVKKTDENVKK